MILNASEYTKAIDIWSVGCILAELYGRTALFPGENYLDQIQRIISVLGTPNFDDVSYIGNDQAMSFIKSLPKRSKQSWKTLFPNASAVGLDLLTKMLTFNPNKRFTVEECLAHPYFEELRETVEEKVCPEQFDWTIDDFEPTEPLLKELIVKEAELS